MFGGWLRRVAVVCAVLGAVGGCGDKEVVVEERILTEEEKARLAPIMEQLGGGPAQMLENHQRSRPNGSAPSQAPN